MRWAWAIGVACAMGGTGAASAQYLVPGAPPMYGTLMVQPGFVPDPMVADGVGGGRVSLSAVNGSCRGYAQEAPNHAIVVPRGMRFLAIMVNSSWDATLFVQTPDGQIFCNDDTDGLSPRVEIATPPGRVLVWVGAYSAMGGGPYRLGLSESPGVRASHLGSPGMPGVVVAPPSPGIAPGARALYGDAVVRAGMRPDPVILTGSAGGPIDANVVDGSCRGWITAEPTHLVTAQTPMSNLRFVVRADHDTTLVVMYPDGRVACNDDGGGSLNPLIEGPTGPGPIRVWVGSYASGRSGPYTLGLTENPGLTHAMLMPGGTGPSVVVVPPTPPPSRPSVVVVPPTPPPPGPGVVVVPPTPPPPGPGVVVAPPRGTLVELLPRIPVTLFDPALGTATVAVWNPRGGPRIEVGVTPADASYAISASVGGTAVPVFTVPAELARDAAVSVALRPDQTLVIRAERPAGAGDPGAVLLLQLRWPGPSASAPEVVQQWFGSARDRLPRWAR